MPDAFDLDISTMQTAGKRAAHAAKHNIETDTLETLRKFLEETNKSEYAQYSFRAMPGEGKAYVQRIRSALSRKRKELRKMRKPLKRFMVRIVSIESTPNYDIVTLARNVTDKNKRENEALKAVEPFLVLD